MGLVRMGVPSSLVIKLRDLLGAKIFIEAGTFQGGTARWAASHFEQVVTIENSKIFYQNTNEKYKDLENINFLFGDTRNHFKEIVPTLEQPAIFWLDSHWCGGDSYGETDQCPLLEELNIINKSQIDHTIIIDDARLFCAPPPIPNDPIFWPTIDKIIDAILTNFPDRYIVIQEDVILAVPGSQREVIEKYCQEIATEEWIAYGKQIKKQQKMSSVNMFKRLVASLFS